MITVHKHIQAAGADMLALFDLDADDLIALLQDKVQLCGALLSQ